MGRIGIHVAAMVLVCVASAGAKTRIAVPANFTVPSLSGAGASFTYAGAAVPGDTLSVTVTGPVYLEPGPAYGTNAAGVVLVAGVDGNQPVGSKLTCGSIDSVEFDCGSLMVSISSGGTTYYGRMFLANKKDGHGRGKPPVSLTYKASLKTLFGKDSGYKAFRFVKPTFTFVVSDTLYSDNTGDFTINNN